jgi:DNA-binding NarL/FixJ family response regulator
MERKNWMVCGEATNGREAIIKVQELAPDVIILDLTMPVMNGYEAVREIRLVAPSIKIVFFTMHDMPVTARQVGADAFVTKSEDPNEVVAAIERVMGLDHESNRQ